MVGEVGVAVGACVGVGLDVSGGRGVAGAGVVIPKLGPVDGAVDGPPTDTQPTNNDATAAQMPNALINVWILPVSDDGGMLPTAALERLLTVGASRE